MEVQDQRFDESDVSVEAEVGQVISKINGYYKEVTKEASTYLRNKFGTKWIETVFEMKEVREKISLYNIIREADSSDTLSLSKLLVSNDPFLKTYKEYFLNKIIQVYETKQGDEKEKILDNLKSFLDGSIKNLSEHKDNLTTMDNIFHATKASLLYGDKEAVDVVVRENYSILNNEFIIELGKLKTLKTVDEIKEFEYNTPLSYFNDPSERMPSDTTKNFFDGEDVAIGGLYAKDQVSFFEIVALFGESDYLAKNLDSFNKIDEKTKISLLISDGRDNFVCENTNLFPDTDRQSLAAIFIENGKSETIFTNETFRDINKEVLIPELISSGNLPVLFSHADQLPTTNIKDLSLNAIENGKAMDVVDLRDKIPNELHNEIIKK